MPPIDRAYYKFLYVACVFASALLVFATVLIVINVVGRFAGLFYIIWAPAMIAYIMLFATMLAAPWVLHKKGHVFMVIVHDALPRVVQVVMERLVYLLSLVVCWGVAALAARAGVEAFVAGSIDIRAIDIPGWVLYAPLVFGFGLMGIEFIVYLLGRDSLYEGEVAADQQGA